MAPPSPTFSHAAEHFWGARLFCDTLIAKALEAAGFEICFAPDNPPIRRNAGGYLACSARAFPWLRKRW